MLVVLAIQIATKNCLDLTCLIARQLMSVHHLVNVKATSPYVIQILLTIVLLLPFPSMEGYVKFSTSSKPSTILV